MTQRGTWRRGAALALLSALLPHALADGGPPQASVAPGPVLARLNFQCQGGVRVQLARRAQTVRVTFAGQSQELRRDPSGTSSRNTQYTWVLQGGVGTMRDNASGQFALSGCRRVN